jgi:hypothetical protein
MHAGDDAICSTSMKSPHTQHKRQQMLQVLSLLVAVVVLVVWVPVPCRARRQPFCVCR